jgi:putative serine protease PepD
VYTVEQFDRSAADIIVALDGEPVETASAFLEKIEEHRPGDTIVLTVLRGGERVDISVELGSS